MDNQLTIQQYIKLPEVEARIQQRLKDNANEFIISLSNLVMQNTLIAKCEPKSLLMAAMQAAAMKLPINPSLGFAYVIPYRQKDGSYLAQLQLGYKSFIQLAVRSGQFKTINVSDIREGELGDTDRLTGEIKFTWLREKREEAKIIGYIAYMELVTGFKKVLYMSNQELEQHAGKYSQSYKSNRATMNLWRDEFGTMASKTVLKLLLSRFAPMTTDMQTAQVSDQAVVTDDGLEYLDNQPIDPAEVAEEKEHIRLMNHINDAKTVEELDQCIPFLPESGELLDMYDSKLIELQTAEIKEKK